MGNLKDSPKRPVFESASMVLLTKAEKALIKVALSKSYEASIINTLIIKLS